MRNDVTVVTARCVGNQNATFEGQLGPKIFKGEAQRMGSGSYLYIEMIMRMRYDMWARLWAYDFEIVGPSRINYC